MIFESALEVDKVCGDLFLEDAFGNGQEGL